MVSQSTGPPSELQLPLSWDLTRRKTHSGLNSTYSFILIDHPFCLHPDPPVGRRYFINSLWKFLPCTPNLLHFKRFSWKRIPPREGVHIPSFDEKATTETILLQTEWGQFNLVLFSFIVLTLPLIHFHPRDYFYSVILYLLRVIPCSTWNCWIL